MKLQELLKNIEPVQIIGDADVEVSGVNIDSRKIKEGHLFVAMKGTQVDGHKFIPKALELGAKSVLCEDMPEEKVEGVTYIQVASTEDAVGKVATLFYGDPSRKLKLVGVTGTNGKTTIATLLYNMFRKFGHKCGLLSTVCNYIEDEAIPADHTTPDPIELNMLLGKMVEAGCEYAFMECSSHAIAQKRIGGLPVCSLPEVCSPTSPATTSIITRHSRTTATPRRHSSTDCLRQPLPLPMPTTRTA